MRQKDLDDLRQFAASPDLAGEMGLAPPDPARADAQARVAAEDQRRATREAEQDRRSEIATHQAERRERTARLAPARGVLTGVGQTVNNQAARLNAFAEHLPTPGGLTPLVATLVVLVSAVVPVNAGYTRLNLLWLTLTGKTSLPDDQQAVSKTPTGTPPGAPPGSVLAPPGQVTQDSANGQTPTSPSGVPSGHRSASYTL